MTSGKTRRLALAERVPTEPPLTVFDAETQDTSYGILVVDRTPLIFDTHRKDEMYVATAELLTETTTPAKVTRREVEAFRRTAAKHGLLAIPYSACFFKGNLHVYAYDGPARGFDLAAVGSSVAEAERHLEEGVKALWEAVPRGVRRAQADLLAGRRRARYDADLEVLRRKLREIRNV
ncbi:MAG: hypothetical protein A3K68_05520 [Euryarchaeota archaeon RBG_16_68_13]|nr:MAG: hypothetical protein A3K68_05520 [Euryarchaeota archaeon RBG_16_68_13]